MKKFVWIIIIGVLFISLLNFKTVIADTKEAIAFNDIKGHWAEKSILQAVSNGYVEGYPDGTFQPEGKVTRAELIRMVVSALKLELGPVGDHWYDTYVNAAISAQFYKYDFTGDLSNPMTRQELAMIAVRATREDVKTAKSFELNRFMYEASKSGIIQGLGNGELGTDQTTTRAQAVTIIERILTLNASGKLPVDKHAVSRAEVAWHKTNVYTMLPRYYDQADVASFSLDKAKWDAADGKYHEEAEEYIIVDTDDPNDPFRSEIEGVKMTLWQYDSKGGYTTIAVDPPKNTYVAFSKVKQVIQGAYPKELIIADGGWVKMANIQVKTTSSYMTPEELVELSKKETNTTIYTTHPFHLPEDLNMAHGHPYFAKKMQEGTFEWISGTVFPKGDMYADNDVIAIGYHPSLTYAKGVGPMYSVELVKGKFNPNIHNE